MAETRQYLVRYGELVLKKRNRDRFVQTLVGQLNARLQAIHGKVIVLHKKLIIESQAPPDAVRRAVSTVFGITGVSPIWKTSHDLNAIQDLAWQLIEPHRHSGKRFAVRAKRAFKRFPMQSPEIQQNIAGSLFQRGLDLPVDLKNPELSLGISIQIHETWLFLETWPGLGGLPVSQDNRHGVLLSGGLDSPVAGHLIQKRGGHLEAIYFHTPPFTVDAAKEKVIALAEILAQYQNGLVLHIVDFSSAMKALVAQCDPKYLVILSRRLMMRIAQELLSKVGGKSIITGESLGQVASQTIENIAVIGENVALPILRPLIGMDKLEIIGLAKKLGSYDVSILPYQDCCSLFSPENPVTKASRHRVHQMEAHLNGDQLVAESVALTEKISIAPRFVDSAG